MAKPMPVWATSLLLASSFLPLRAGAVAAAASEGGRIEYGYNSERVFKAVQDAGEGPANLTTTEQATACLTERRT